MVSRRAFVKANLALWAQWCLLGRSLDAKAFSGKVKLTMEAWLKEQVTFHRDIRARNLTPVQWQEAMETLYQKMPLADLIAGLDLDRLMAHVKPPGKLAAIQQVPLPMLQGQDGLPAFGHKLFIMKRDGAVIPHAHNDMVSAHLVVRGRFHVRTFHRRFDMETEPGFMVLEPSLDRIFHPGDVLTMSDDRDNIHWLIAKSDVAVTFDVPVTNLGSGKAYQHEANRYSMIFVDPNHGKRHDGLHQAKILNYDEAVKQFAS